jgi:nitrite reductase/ring-hydroxylating ferredoxin subunit
MKTAMDDRSVAQRVLDHIANGTTDVGEEVWREPVANYQSKERLAVEIERVLRRSPTPFCPAAALPEVGSYIARDAAGTPIVVVRGADGKVRAFRNACRHRGMQVASDSGCTRAFVCRYHGWTYNLEGRLRHIPHEAGFPGFDKEMHPLVPMTAGEINLSRPPSVEGLLTYVYHLFPNVLITVLSRHTNVVILEPLASIARGRSPTR